VPPAFVAEIGIETLPYGGAFKAWPVIRPVEALNEKFAGKLEAL
jgi:hypothetical protein